MAADAEPPDPERGGAGFAVESSSGTGRPDRCSCGSGGVGTGPAESAIAARSASSTLILASSEATSWRSRRSSRRASSVRPPPARAARAVVRRWVRVEVEVGGCAGAGGAQGVGTLLPEPRFRIGPWTLLVESGPRDGAAPALPHGSVALVARTGRRSLAAERVTGVQPPQTAVVAHPRRVVVDDLAGPLQVLLRARWRGRHRAGSRRRGCRCRRSPASHHGRIRASRERSTASHPGRSGATRTR